MLSIERCRELIAEGDKLSDEEVEQIRNTLYGLSELALDCYFEEKRKVRKQL